MRFENVHAKSVNASAKPFQEEEEQRDEMRWGRSSSSSSRRLELSQAACWLMLIRRLINYQQNVLRGSSKQRQLQVATGNWQLVATLSGMLRFVVVLTYAMARTKKFTLHLDGCATRQRADIVDDGDDVDEAARHVGRAWHGGRGMRWGLPLLTWQFVICAWPRPGWLFGI